MNSKSSAGKFPKLAASEGVFVVAVDLEAILTRGLLGFVVAVVDEEDNAEVPGVLVGRFFSVVTFFG